MANDLWLVVGLGNPGPTYAGNRHNAGFMVADLLADRMGGKFKAHKGRADAVEGRLAGQRVFLAKPKCYMNESGGPVASLRDFFKVPAERIVVVYDELDIPFGTLRLKRGGGDNGHNGRQVDHQVARHRRLPPGALRHRPATRPAGRRRPSSSRTSRPRRRRSCPSTSTAPPTRSRRS